MRADPIRQRWRDFSPASGADGERSPETTAADLFRAAPDPRPQTLQATARLLAELRARARPGRFDWRRRLIGGWRLAAFVLVFASVNLALASTLPSVRHWWSQVIVVRASRPSSRAAAPPRSSALPHASPPSPEIVQPRAEVAAEASAFPQPELPARARRPQPASLPTPPPPVPVVAAAQSQAPSLAGESALVSRALAALSQGRPSEALAAIAIYRRQFPHGSLAFEASLAEVKAQMAAGQDGRALAALDQILAADDGLDGLPRSSDLILLRAELQARTRGCAQALPTFEQLASSESLASPLVERALYGRASCLASQGDHAASRRALLEYLRRFPEGRFAAVARAALGP